MIGPAHKFNLTTYFRSRVGFKRQCLTAPQFLLREQVIKIRIKSTGEIQEVTRNVAFDLIDRKIAVLATTPLTREEQRIRPPTTPYNPQETENRQEDTSLYSDRQMRDSRHNRRV